MGITQREESIGNRSHIFYEHGVKDSFISVIVFNELRNDYVSKGTSTFHKISKI
jgi:hypothetical protein